jgi:hypothetical protein
VSVCVSVRVSEWVYECVSEWVYECVYSVYKRVYDLMVGIQRIDDGG